MRATRQTNLRKIGPLGLAVILACAVAPRVNGQETPLARGPLAEVEKAWRERQARFPAVQMRWTIRDTYLKGGLSKVFPARTNANRGTQPDRDTTFDAPAEFALDGNKARYDYQGWEYHLDECRFNTVKYAAAFDGLVTRTCDLERDGKQSYPMGRVVSKGTFEEARGASLRPIVLFFRPLKGEFFGLDLNTFTVVNTAAKVRDIPCWELQHRRGKSAVHLWVDPAKGYLAIKLLLLDSGVPGQQTEMRYGNAPGTGWVPEGWVISFMDRQGSVYQTERAKVDSLVTVAPPVTRFDLAFPAGALVNDQLATRQWIVRADGSKRMISKEERGLPYADLIRADGTTTARFVRDWLKPSLLALGLGCVVVVLWRLSRPNRDNPTGQTSPG